MQGPVVGHVAAGWPTNAHPVRARPRPRHPPRFPPLSSLFGELDYEAEGKASEKFAALYAGAPRVRVPAVHWGASARRVLTLEWVDGVKLTDEAGMAAAGLDVVDFGATCIQCSNLFVPIFVVTGPSRARRPADPSPRPRRPCRPAPPHLPPPPSPLPRLLSQRWHRVHPAPTAGARLLPRRPPPRRGGARRGGGVRLVVAVIEGPDPLLVVQCLVDCGCGWMGRRGLAARFDRCPAAHAPVPALSRQSAGHSGRRPGVAGLWHDVGRPPPGADGHHSPRGPLGGP